MTTEKLSIDVIGMTCASCSARIEKQLNKLDGVDSALVNLLANKAVVEFDNTKLDKKTIVKTIEKTGYEVPLKRTTMFIEGMTCAACSARVEKALQKVDGVVNASVNLSTNKATVDYASGSVEESFLVKTVEKAGYGAEVEKDENRDKDKDIREKEIKSLQRSFIIALIFTLPLFSAIFFHMAGQDNLLTNGYVQLELATPVQFFV